MNFEIEKDTVRDMMVIHGPVKAAEDITMMFLSSLETLMVEISDDIQKEKMNRSNG